MSLTVVDDTTLKMTGGDDVGFASPGESLSYAFGDSGVDSVRAGSGTTGYPFDRFAAAAARRQDRVTIGDPLTP